MGILTKNSYIDETLKIFNEQNKNIEFTLEREVDKRINYLDLTIIREDNGQLSTIWYEKEIKKGIFLNYHSTHPFYQKRNSILNLLKKSISLTDKKFIPTLKHRIFKKLEKNSYLHQIIKKFWHIATAHTTKIDKIDNTKFFKSLTYIQGLTENIQRTFKEFDCNEVKFGLKPINKVKNKFHHNLKDKTDSFKKTDVIYKISCKDCDKIYIGETKQRLENRIKQHNYDIKAKNGNTALSTHTTAFNHKIDKESIKIIDIERNETKRKYLEAAYISMYENSINYKTDSKELNKYYSAVLKI